MLVRTVLVVLSLVLTASAKPAANPDYYGGIFDSPFFRSPSFDDEVSAEESVSAPDFAELPIGPVGPAVPGSFSSLGSMLDGIFHRMRQQFERFPTPSFQMPKFPSIAFNPSGFGLPSKPGNSTSTSTVVGDHVVTVNETVFHKDDGGFKSVFRIKVIDVSPNQEKKKPAVASTTSSTEGSVEEIVEVDLPAEVAPESSETAPESTEVEVASSTQQVEDFDNEIPKQNPEESLMERIQRWNQQQREKQGNSPDNEVEIIPAAEAAESPIELRHDLSGDLRVNQILQDQVSRGALFMPDPDTEFIEVDDTGKMIPSLQDI